MRFMNHSRITKSAMAMAIVASAVTAGACMAQNTPANEPVGKIVVFGVFKEAGTEQDGGALTNKEIVPTNVVPMKLGVRFGLCAEVKGLQPDGPHAVTVSLRHPPYTGANGIETNGYNSPQMLQSEFGVARWCGSHLLRQKLELVPGIWRFEVSYNGVDLFAQEFKLQSESTEKK